MHPGSIPGEASNTRFGALTGQSGVGQSGVEQAESAARRQKMVDGQLRTGGVNDAAVLAAFLSVPREEFVAVSSLALAYSDAPQKARAGGAPMVSALTLARLLQALGPKPGQRALDVAGVGYSAALMRAMGAEVVAIDGDVASGTKASLGTFDAILVNGGFSVDPNALTAFLATKGKLVGVRLSDSGDHAVVIERAGPNALEESVIFEASAPPLAAFAKSEAFAF